MIQPIENSIKSKLQTDGTLSFIDRDGTELFTIPADEFDDLEVGHFKITTDLIEEDGKKYARSREFTRTEDGSIVFIN